MLSVNYSDTQEELMKHSFFTARNVTRPSVLGPCSADYSYLVLYFDAKIDLICIKWLS